MRRGTFAFVACCLAVVCGGCASAGKPTQPAAQRVRAEDLVGKWRLVGAGGQPPAALNIKSLLLDIAADGTWKSQVQMQGTFAGVSMEASSKWSLTDDLVTYTAAANSGKSLVRIESRRLILDPDFIVRKDGVTEVAGEYER
jgi:hypothetical protein